MRPGSGSHRPAGPAATEHAHQPVTHGRYDATRLTIPQGFCAFACRIPVRASPAGEMLLLMPETCRLASQSGLRRRCASARLVRASADRARGWYTLGNRADGR